MKDWLIYAWLQGFIERLPNDSCGRTHPTNQDWNEAYDRGRYFAARLLGDG
jgi:hypothetical protein